MAHESTVTARPTALAGALLAVCVAGGAAGQVGEFVRWTDARGVISAEVPRGWTVEGGAGPAIDLGQFQVTATSPDGRSFISFAHNWNSFMEYQYGPYRAGHATIEGLVLPSFLQSDPRYRDARVTYRSAIRPVPLPPTPPGVRLAAHAGTLGFLLEDRTGRISAGSAFAETLYLPGAGHPGLWRLRVFASALAPADDRAQATARGALERLVATLRLEGAFLDAWAQAHDRTVTEIRRYSAVMDRTFSRYLQPVARTRREAARDPMQAWADMMRGGEYAENPETGEEYWVPSEWNHAWVTPRGDVLVSSTGEPPRTGAPLTALRFPHR